MDCLFDVCLPIHLWLFHHPWIVCFVAATPPGDCLSSLSSFPTADCVYFSCFHTTHGFALKCQLCLFMGCAFCVCFSIYDRRNVNDFHELFVSILFAKIFKTPFLFRLCLFCCGDALPIDRRNADGPTNRRMRFEGERLSNRRLW